MLPKENQQTPISCSSSIPSISYDTISNNISSNGGGIFCQTNSTPIISNSIITNNIASSNGGGIYCSNSNVTIINCTISNNFSAKGGALFCTSSSDPTLRNTIMWSDSATSGNEVYLDDEPSDPNIYYCDVKGSSSAFGVNTNVFYIGTYTNNINSNPMFVAPSGGSGTGFNGVTADWSLQISSPCINAGDPSGTYPATDILGNPRVVGSCIDIGAFESQTGSGMGNYYLQNRIIISPNPFSTQTTLQTDNSFRNATITVDNCFGQTVAQIKYINRKTVIFSRDNLASGLYFVRITENNDLIAVDKLVITDK